MVGSRPGAGVPGVRGNGGATRPEVLAPEFAWRTLRLLNAFRLLYCAFLFGLLIYPSEPRFVGEFQPELFLAAVLTGFVFAAINDFAVNQHWPSVGAQALAQGLFDIAIISVLTWASGGLVSGLGNLLIITIGALSFISTRLRAMAFAAVATLAVLGLQVFGIARGTISVSDVAPAGLFGGLLMVLAFAAEAPSTNDAATPRPSPIPPAAITGRSTASAIAGTSASVPTLARGASCGLKAPRCPPASAPWAMIASAPAACACKASSSVVAVANQAMPRTLSAAA